MKKEKREISHHQKCLGFKYFINGLMIMAILIFGNILVSNLMKTGCGNSYKTDKVIYKIYSHSLINVDNLYAGKINIVTDYKKQTLTCQLMTCPFENSRNDTLLCLNNFFPINDNYTIKYKIDGNPCNDCFNCKHKHNNYITCKRKIDIFIAFLCLFC